MPKTQPSYEASAFLCRKWLRNFIALTSLIKTPTVNKIQVMYRDASARVCGRSLLGIAGSNLAGFMDDYLVNVVCAK